MLNINKKSHMLCHVITLRLFGALKSYAYGKITKEYLIDSTPLVKSN